MINRSTLLLLLSAFAPLIQSTPEGHLVPKRGLRIAKVSEHHQNQKISGRLLSPQSKEPVPGSTVTLYKCLTQKGLSDPCTKVCDGTTDASGHYGDSPCFSSLQPTDATFFYQVCIENPLGPTYNFTPGKKPGTQDVTPTANNSNVACSDPVLVPPNTVQVVNGELGAPTKKPTKAPTKKPTKAPTKKPTKAPTKKPTKKATASPTKAPPSNVNGTIFNDYDDDGSLGPNDTVRPGQNVTLVDCNGKVIATVLTDANGNFVFPGVSPNTCYTVLVGPVSDCNLTGDVNSSSGSSNQFTLAPGKTQSITAGVNCPASKATPCISNDVPGDVKLNCPPLT